MLLAMLSCVVLVLGPAVIYLIPLFAVCAIVFFALKALFREARVKGRELPDTGELPYGFAGHELLAFSDPDGQVWIRAKDIRHLLGLERSDAWMAQAYPQGYRRAHPGVAAWYIRPDTVRRHWGGSNRIAVNQFIHWMERELVPLHEKRSAVVRAQAHASPASSEAERQPSPWLGPLRHCVDFFTGHWRGQHRFLHVALSGALLALLVGHVLQDIPAPADLVEHYRRYALLLIFELLGGTLLCAWWGVGVWRMTQRWLSAERSLLIGIAFAMGGMTTLLYAFDRLADRDQQMTLMALGIMAADLGPKPVVTVTVDGKRVVPFRRNGLRHNQPCPCRVETPSGDRGDRVGQPGRKRRGGFCAGRTGARPWSRYLCAGRLRQCLRARFCWWPRTAGRAVCTLRAAPFGRDLAAWGSGCFADRPGDGTVFPGEGSDRWIHRAGVGDPVSRNLGADSRCGDGERPGHRSLARAGTVDGPLAEPRDPYLTITYHGAARPGDQPR